MYMMQRGMCRGVDLCVVVVGGGVDLLSGPKLCNILLCEIMLGELCNEKVRDKQNDACFFFCVV